MSRPKDEISQETRDRMIKKHGEPHFRRIEALAKALARKEPVDIKELLFIMASKRTCHNVETLGDELYEKTRRRGKGEGYLIDSLSGEEHAAILKKSVFAQISAYKNPKLEPDMTREQEIARHERLISDITEAGYAFIVVERKYGDVEASVLVVMPFDVDRKEVARLGERYNQDSIIFGAGGNYQLIYTIGEMRGRIEEVSSYAFK